MIRAGHDAVAAQSGRDALPIIREGGIDLIIAVGYDSCAAVVELARALEPLPDAPPIVLVSGSPAAPEISVRIGAAQFIAKPCEPSEIVAAANRLVATPSQRMHAVEVDDEPTSPHRLLG